jgi:RNA polymerase sigma factor (sigma-70 family)
LVLGTCRRILGDANAAEDAFQASFLLLARKAGAVRWHGSAGPWLYAAACRVSNNARRAAVRRRHHEARARVRPSGDALEELSGRELCRALDEELNRLPERLRGPLVLCYLEGRTRDEAAQQLGWGLATLKRRLERGREWLRRRLEARGLTVPAVIGGSLVAGSATAVPPQLVRATVQAALAIPVAALSLKTLAAVVVLVVFGIGVGLTRLPGRRSEAPAAPPPSAAPEPAARVDVLGDPLPDGALARLGSRRLRPGDAVQALAFSPGGRRLACWSGGGSNQDNFTVWDSATGQLLRRVDMPGTQLKALHWLTDGRGAAVVRIGPEEYFVWDFTDDSAPAPQVPAGVAMNSYGDSTLLDVTISPDGRWLAAGRVARQNQPKAIEVWELELNRPLNRLKSRAVGAQVGHGVGVVFTPDSKTVIAFSRKLDPDQQGFVQLGPSRAPPGEPEEQARCVAWDVATGQERTAFDPTAPGGFNLSFGIHQPVPRTFAVTPDGQTLIVGQRDGALRLWDWQAGRERRSFPAHPAGSRQPAEAAGVVALAVRGDGRTLVTAGMFGGPRRWNLTTNREIGSADEGLSIFQSITISPDGKLLAGGTTTGQVRIWDLATGAEHCPVPGHSSTVEMVYVLSDGRTALTASSDRTVRSWDITTGREQRRVPLEAPQWCWPTGFTPDGRGLIGRSIWSGYTDHEKYLWDTGTGQRLPLAEAFTLPRCWIKTAPVNGSVLALDGGDQTLTLRDWPSGRLRQTFRPPIPELPGYGYQTNAAALAADGRLAAAVGEDRRRDLRGHGWVSLYNAATGAVLHRWDTSDAIYQRVAITPDGLGVVVGGAPMVGPTPVGTPRPPWKAGQALLLLDAETGESIRRFLPPRTETTAFRYITAIAISPDGRQLAAAERDHVVHVYELATGQSRRKLAGHTNEVTSLAFTPDGRRLISVSRDVTGLVWDVSLSAAGRAGTAPQPADADRLWAELAKPEWELAGPALATLAAHPEAAVGLLTQRLRPADQPPRVAEEVERLVRQMDSPKYGARELAAAELRRLGRSALPHLRRHAKDTASAEVRGRLTQLIQGLADVPLPSEQLRELRALELLEQVGTPTARAHLRALAGGHREAELTRAAADALKWLEKRP